MKKAGLVRKKKMWIILVIILICLVIAIIAILPPSVGKVKQFVDENGKIIEGSIAEKTFVNVNGTSLGMFIMAKDSNKPVLLYLGGGPGIPMMVMEKNYPSGLENEFILCYPEYRGTSLSYDPDTPVESMTIEQYVDDTVEITNYLLNRFKQEKIYLVGHSFGSYVGIKVVDQHPELYHAYIAVAQISDPIESEMLAYDYMYEQYKAQGNTRMTKWFEKYPVTSPEDVEKYITSSLLRDTAMHDLGVGSAHGMNSVISGIFFPSLRNTVYTPAERINIWRGKIFAGKTPVGLSHLFFNAFSEIPEIEVPIYFFAGIYDYTVCYSLQQKYYEYIKAPLKAFYTFQNSAHSPPYEEPEKALEILTQDVLNGKKTLSDQ
jgi:pimeloyl-ACP methyl ester carboxylesterase